MTVRRNRKSTEYFQVLFEMATINTEKVSCSETFEMLLTIP